ncbi:hypothetical protein [Flavobacterium sp.]|uniref:hypothetical protein n=1 Tax=Flavobacterium sp. TaxID=239 RepID=UPI003D6AD427
MKKKHFSCLKKGAIPPPQTGFILTIFLSEGAGNVKDTFHLVTKEEAKQREGLLLYRKRTDANGNFEIEIDEKYMGSDFDIDFVCGSQEQESIMETLEILTAALL